MAIEQSPHTNGAEDQERIPTSLALIEDNEQEISILIGPQNPLQPSEHEYVAHVLKNLQDRIIDVSEESSYDIDDVGYILREIGKYPLLTEHEERILTSSYRRINQEIKNLIKINSDDEFEDNSFEINTDTMSDKEKEFFLHEGDITEISEKYESKDYSEEEIKEKLSILYPSRNIIRDTLVNHNLRLVFSIAKKHTGRGISLPDLFNEGSIGLMSAIERFQPELGYRFSTYATFWIRQGIGRSIADTSRTIRLPVHEYDFFNKIRNTDSALSLKLGRKPTLDEIAVEMDVPQKEIEKRYSSAAHKLTTSIHTIVNDEKKSELGNFIPDPDDQIEHIIENADYETIIKIAQDLLTEREFDVFMRRVATHPSERETLDDVGKLHGISRERIRQIEVKSMRKMAKALKGKGYSL